MGVTAFRVWDGATDRWIRFGRSLPRRTLPRTSSFAAWLQRRGVTMDTQLREPETQTFVETALKLSGKSEEEARTTGSLDRADDQVEALFATRYQTSHSPVHRAVWGREVPIELFQSQPPVVTDACRRVMDESLAIVR